MRYFLICDDSGTPVYCDHPDGMMMGLIFNGLDKFLTERDEHFSQKFKSMACGGVLFVAQKGESEMYLRTLLRHMYGNPIILWIIFEHMVMLFGLQVMLEGRYTSFTRHKKTIQHIVDTTCALGDRHQAMLVRATERLEVNDRTRGECFNALKNTVQNDRLITHALVFVGTKLLVSYTRGGKAQDIDPSDLLLLITDFHASFHPPDREVREMELPVADYRDHTNITIRGAQRGQDTESTEQFILSEEADSALDNSCEQPSALKLAVEPDAVNDTSSLEQITPHDHHEETAAAPHVDSLGSALGEDTSGESRPNTHHVSTDTTNQTAETTDLADTSSVLLENAAKQQSDDANLRACASYTERSILPLDLNNGHELAEDEHDDLGEINSYDEHKYESSREDAKESIGEEQNQEQVPDDEKEEEEEFQLRKDGEYDPNKLTKYKALHLRTPRYAPCWVYYAELGHKITLVLLTSNSPQISAKGTSEERSELDSIRDSMRSLLQTYSTYLITKEHTHLPILSFLHQFPGLVHFIFVDRTFNRVIAPSISALHTMDRPPEDEEEERAVKRVIKRHVWNMCYQSQQYLSEGVQSIVKKDGPWQYSYRLWVEDVDGFELIFPPEAQIATPHVPQTNKFYQKLIHRFFPTRGNLRCYELFTLYLSALSAEAVAHHDRDLVALLLNRAVK